MVNRISGIGVEVQSPGILNIIDMFLRNEFPNLDVDGRRMERHRRIPIHSNVHGEIVECIVEGSFALSMCHQGAHKQPTCTRICVWLDCILSGWVVGGGKWAMGAGFYLRMQTLFGRGVSFIMLGMANINYFFATSTVSVHPLSVTGRRFRIRSSSIWPLSF